MRPTVVRFRVGAVRVRRVVHVASPLRPLGEDLVVVVRGQRRSPARVGRADRVLRLRVPGRELVERDRPVEQVRAVDAAVRAARPELVLVEARRRARPVRRRAADRLDDPRGQVREVLRDAPRPARRARIQPGHLVERLPLVVLVVLVAQVRAGLEHHNGDALRRQLVRDRAAASARPDDHDDVVVLRDRLPELRGACARLLGHRSTPWWLAARSPGWFVEMGAFGMRTAPVCGRCSPGSGAKGTSAGSSMSSSGTQSRSLKPRFT